MKVRFRSVAIVFGASFIVFGGVLMKYMVQSVTASQAIAATELKKSKDIHLESIPSHNEGLELGGILFVNQCAGCPAGSLLPLFV